MTAYWFLNKDLIIITALFTVISGFHYLIIGFQILGRPDHEAAADND
jgi:hypothetical protein